MYHQDGAFDGVYIIRGIQKILPGSSRPVAFERQKTVTVKRVFFLIFWDEKDILNRSIVAG